MALATETELPHTRTATPWWLSLVFALGFVALFLGQRVLASAPGVASGFTWAAISAIAAATGLRLIAVVQTRGARRRVEVALLLCQLAAVAAMLLYWYAQKAGNTELAPKSGRYLRTPLTVLWTILLTAGALPQLLIEFGLGAARREWFDFKPTSHAGVEAMRVRELGWSGLTIGLAASLLMVTCNVANQKNVRRDVSYFKTSAPGTSTKAIVSSLSAPLEVLLFFPAVNEVKDEVKDYFAQLAKLNGKLTVAEHDRMLASELAKKHAVTKDGAVVIIRGDKSERIELETDMEKARRGAGKLRNLDKEVNAALMKVMREKRKAYLSIGHGEVNDPGSVSPLLRGKVPERQATLVKPILTALGYETIDLSPADLATDVPKDATVLLILGPTQALDGAEQAALDRFLQRGGRLLFALNPLGEADFGTLGPRLGVALDRGLLTDDKAYFAERGNSADYRNIFTTQVSSHASTTTLSRAGRMRLPVLSSGALVDAPFATTPGTSAESPKRIYTIRTMDTTWADRNDNFAFDAANEKREKFNVGAAIEGPRIAIAPADGGKSADAKDPSKPAQGSNTDTAAQGSGHTDPHAHAGEHDHGADAKAPETHKDGFRALVYANAAFFTDALGQDISGRVRRVMVGGDMLFDAVLWLGGEEAFTGEVITEDDKPIKHTKSEDAAWFTLTILGAPTLVLTGGLLGTGLRKRRRRTHRAKPARVAASEEKTP